MCAVQATPHVTGAPIAEAWHLLEDNLLREVFAASLPSAKRDGRLVCKSWKRMVGLTVTSFKTKAADYLNHTGEIQCGQPLLPDVISPQRLLQLLPNLKTLDLCEGVQTDTLLSGSVLSAFTGLTKLHLKLEPKQLQSSLADLRKLPAQLALNICAFDRLHGCLQAEHFPEGVVELKLSGVHICFQSMQIASTLTALTALCVDQYSLECNCCHPYTFLWASYRELVSLTLDSVPLPTVQHEELAGLDLKKLVYLTVNGTICPGVLQLTQYIRSGLQAITLQFTAQQSGALLPASVLLAVSYQLTTLHVGLIQGSNNLFLLSNLPFLKTLSLRLSIDDSDNEAPVRLRALALSPCLRQVSLDFTTTNRTLVALFTCQLFAHAGLLEQVQFRSEKASRFVTPSQQPYASITELELQECLSVDDKGLKDTVACFPALTSLHVSSPSVTAVGVQGLTSLTRLHRLSIIGCPLLHHKDMRKFVVAMRHLGVLSVDPQVLQQMRKHQRKARPDLLLDDGVCRQM